MLLAAAVLFGFAPNFVPQPVPIPADSIGIYSERHSADPCCIMASVSLSGSVVYCRTMDRWMCDRSVPGPVWRTASVPEDTVRGLFNAVSALSHRTFYCGLPSEAKWTTITVDQLQIAWTLNITVVCAAPSAEIDSLADSIIDAIRSQSSR